MKVLIVDPAVHSQGGHHFNAVQRLQEELSAMGVDAPCLGSAYADTTTLHELACTPTFTRSVYGRDYASSDEFARDVVTTSRQLTGALRRLRTWPDVLILPCCDQVLAAAIARVVARRWLKPLPQIVLWLLYGPHHRHAGDDPAARPLLEECRTAFASLAAAIGDARRLAAFCETPAMARFYADLLPFDVDVARGPGLTPPAKISAKVKDAPIVASIGFANRAKGYRLLPDAVREALRRHDHVRFMIHGIVSGSDASDEYPVFEQLAGLGDRVVVRRDVLSHAEYGAWLAQTDLLLMPYDPHAYKARGSGIFAEARRVGIPIVATRGCAFAQPAFDDGWGVGIREHSGSGVADAVVDALDRLDDLTDRAALAAARTHDDLGPLLQATLDRARAHRSIGLIRILRRLRKSSA